MLNPESLQPFEFQNGQIYGLASNVDDIGGSLYSRFTDKMFENFPAEVKRDHFRFQPIVDEVCQRTYLKFERMHMQDIKAFFRNRNCEQTLQQLRRTSIVFSECRLQKVDLTMFQEIPATSVEFVVEAKNEESLLVSFEKILLHCLELPFEGLFFDCCHKKHFIFVFRRDLPFFCIVATFRIVLAESDAITTGDNRKEK